MAGLDCLNEDQKAAVVNDLNSNLMIIAPPGSGKTLTPVVSSYWYLQLYPTNKVLIISPSALLYNFIEGMRQYGLDIQENRYTYTTYEK